MMLVVAAQEGASLALPLDFLGQGKSQHFRVPALECLVVVDEQLHRTDAGDLEGLGQQHAVDVVL